jgi:hypothetical protein
MLDEARKIIKDSQDGLADCMFLQALLLIESVYKNLAKNNAAEFIRA